MQTFLDFLSFKIFITPDILVIAYAVGAIGIPIASVLMSLWLRKKIAVLGKVYDEGKKQLKAATSANSRVILIVLFLAIFILMEVMWRMMFEFMIAYFQMRDVLVGLSGM